MLKCTNQFLDCKRAKAWDTEQELATGKKLHMERRKSLATVDFKGLISFLFYEDELQEVT